MSTKDIIAVVATDELIMDAWIEKAEEYYNIIKQDFPDADFYPLSYDKMDVRIERLNEMARNSDYKYVIILYVDVRNK